LDFTKRAVVYAVSGGIAIRFLFIRMTVMKKKLFFAGMAALLLTFGLVLLACVNWVLSACVNWDDVIVFRCWPWSERDWVKEGGNEQFGKDERNTYFHLNFGNGKAAAEFGGELSSYDGTAALITTWDELPAVVTSPRNCPVQR
jgi:hypothetical protein